MAGRRRLAANAAALAIAAGLTAAACAEAGTRDPLQVADTLQAATPAASPPAASRPAGRLYPLAGPVTALAVTNGVLAVAATNPDRVLLYSLADPAAAPRVAAASAPVAHLDTSAGHLLAAVPRAGVLLRIDPATAAARTVRLDGHPTAATTIDGRTVVALEDRVLVLDAQDRVVHTVGGFAGAAAVVGAKGRLAVLDRLRTALYTVDAGTGRRGPALRAGNGATNAVGDRFGRVLVTDTRDGELLAFTADPMIMRQRFPVPGAPYAIAYDARRDLAWVTLTERNEVVGFDVAGGEPVERYRLTTVRQPNAVTVDEVSGAVVVASGTDEGIQVVQP